MKKVKGYKGYIIAEYNEREKEDTNYAYGVFTKDEWSSSPFAVAEYECDSIKECEENIDTEQN